MTKRINPFPLQLSFFLFSMLLNCMGIVILKYSGTYISYQKLGFLEFFKDLPIAIISLFSVNLINRLGTKKSLLFALILVFLCCVALPLVSEFWFFKVWFALIGSSFAFAKISVFGIIRNNIQSEKELSKIMNRVESAFMIGIFLVNTGFGWLLSSRYEMYWKFGFWGIALISLITIWYVSKNEYQENKEKSSLDLSYLKSIFNYQNLYFFLILFLIVMLEQCFNSWLPTFYKKNLGVNSFFALQASAFLALFSFIGRYYTSYIIVKFNWYRYVLFCLIMALFVVLIIQAMMYSVENYLILIMILFPCIGLFLSPLYPLYNSKILMRTGKEKVNLLVSCIMIFSSIGSSFGSMGISLLFQHKLDNNFVLFLSIPLLIILGVTIIFSRKLNLKK